MVCYMMRKRSEIKRLLLACVLFEVKQLNWHYIRKGGRYRGGRDEGKQT